MTIGPAVPAVPGTSEKIPGVAGESAAAPDMFGGIIAAMAAAVGAEATESEGEASSAQQTEAPPAEAAAAASVAQLLALTARQQGKAAEKPATEAGEEAPQGCCELPLQMLDDDTPEILPLGGPIATQATQKVPIAKTAETAPSAVIVAPQAKPDELAKKVAEIAKALVEQPDAESEAPKTVAAAQIADLLKAVTRPITLANARTPASEQPLAKEDLPVSAPEARSLVQAALSAAIPANLAGLDAARPLDTILEPAIAEPQLDPAEFAIERQLDVSAEGEWLDSLAKDIARSAGEGGTLRFKLNPENLGSLRVEITPQANGSVVRLTADTDAARTIIADAQQRLVAEAKANGVRISETHVDLGGQNSPGDPRRQNAQFEEAPIRTARFLRDQEDSDGKPTRSQSERYA